MSALTLALHGMLTQAGLADLARVAWAAHLDVAELADELGAEIGVEVSPE